MPSLHGYELDCDRELKRCSDAPGVLGTIRVRESDSHPLDASGEIIHLIPDPEYEPAFTLARLGSSLLAWHADAGSFAIDAERVEISYREGDATRSEPELRWEDRLGSTAVPLLAGGSGALPLHAAANVINGRCLVICGVSGRGKSTLSAALAARGHPLLAEDGAVVHRDEGRPVVRPGVMGALVTESVAEAIGGREASGSASDGRGRSLLRVPDAARSAEVAAVAVLAERSGTTVEIERLDAARAHRELLSQVLSGGRAGPGAFTFAARLAEQAPVFLVRVPDRIESLAGSAQSLSELC